MSAAVRTSNGPDCRNILLHSFYCSPACINLLSVVFHISARCASLSHTGSRLRGTRFVQIDTVQYKRPTTSNGRLDRIPSSIVALFRSETNPANSRSWFAGDAIRGDAAADNHVKGPAWKPFDTAQLSLGMEVPSKVNMGVGEYWLPSVGQLRAARGSRW